MKWVGRKFLALSISFQFFTSWEWNVIDIQLIAQSPFCKAVLKRLFFTTLVRGIRRWVQSRANSAMSHSTTLHFAKALLALQLHIESVFDVLHPRSRFKGLPAPAIGKDSCQPKKPQLCRGFLPSRLLRKAVMVFAAQAGSVRAASFVCTVALVNRFRERSASPSTSLCSCLQAPVHPPAASFVLACWLIRLQAWRA